MQDGIDHTMGHTVVPSGIANEVKVVVDEISEDFDVSDVKTDLH